MGRVLCRIVTVLYLFALLAAPVGFVFGQAFRHGFTPAWNAVSSPDGLHALYLTAVATVIAIPLNAIFGVAFALLLVRSRSRAARVLNVLIDVPFALSPVVAGLALVILFGANEPIGSWLDGHGIQILFALPAIVIATTFVSMPFVAREVIPVLREVGTEQEQAAATLGASGWQSFRLITLPAIRWALIYGVVLSVARALGEFGAVSLVAGHLIGQTETLTLRVQNSYQDFDDTSAYATAVLLALLAIATLTVTRVSSWIQTVRGRRR